MDSLPQELIDKIIGNLPRSSLLPCSLVAKRWRRGSQQRAFQRIELFYEDQVNRWYRDTLQDPDGVASYFRVVRFKDIPLWNDLTIFGRVLKSLGSLMEFWVYRTEIPGELPGIILSLPNLKVLSITAVTFESKELLSTHPAPPQRGPLDLLELRGDVGGLGMALARSQLTSRRLTLAVPIQGIEQLIMHSSETVVELKLYGMWLLRISRRQER